MAGQMQLAFFLAIIVVVYGNALPATIENHDISPQTKITRVNLDNLFDKLLPTIRQVIMKNGMDPLQLIDFSQDIMKLLPGKLKGSIDFKNGWMQEMSKLKRSNHIIAEYQNKILSLKMDLKWKILEFNYDYYLKYLLIKRQGGVYGRFYSMDSNIGLAIDLVNYKVTLESFQYNGVGSYEITFEGHLLDRVLNMISKAITTIFKDRVLKDLQSRSEIIFRGVLERWNKEFPRPNRI